MIAVARSLRASETLVARSLRVSMTKVARSWMCMSLSGGSSLTLSSWGRPPWIGCTSCCMLGVPSCNLRLDAGDAAHHDLDLVVELLDAGRLDVCIHLQAPQPGVRRICDLDCACVEALHDLLAVLDPRRDALECAREHDLEVTQDSLHGIEGGLDRDQARFSSWIRRSISRNRNACRFWRGCCCCCCCCGCCCCCCGLHGWSARWEGKGSRNPSGLSLVSQVEPSRLRYHASLLLRTTLV